MPGLTPRDATAALALVTARTEPNYMVTAFSTQMIPLEISANMRLNDAIKTVSGLPFSGTHAGPTLSATPPNSIRKADSRRRECKGAWRPGTK